MNYTGKELVTAPATEPVTLDEAKLQLRVSGVAEDTLIGYYIKTARELAERVTGRALMTQTWKIFLNTFPDSKSIEIPLAPLQEVTHLKYYDETGTQETFTLGEESGGALGEVVTTTEPGLIRLYAREVWPATEYDRSDAIEIQFVAGYASALLVPASFKAILLAMIVYLYENRGEFDLKVFERLLLGHRVWSIF